MVVREESRQEVRFRPRRLAHANINVGNNERSMEFYNKVCGFEVVRQAPTIKSGSLTNGNTNHDLGLPQIVSAEDPLPGRPFPGNLVPGLNHLGWELENEVELVAAYDRALQAGLKIDTTQDHMVSRGVYLRDPEGNGHEFYADTVKDWKKALAELSGSPDWTPGNPPPMAESNYPVNPLIRRVEDAIFHPRCITHAAVVVADFEVMFRFYTGVAGLEPVLGGPGGNFALFSGTCPGFDLAMFPTVAGRPAGLHHVGFVVDDERDLEESGKRLREAGIELEIQLTHASKRSMFIRDPDGNLLEFYSERSAPLRTLSDLEAGVALHLA